MKRIPFITMLFILLFVSCAKSYPLVENASITSNNHSNELIGLSRLSKDISSEDAICIAAIFLNNNHSIKTKATSLSVIPVKDNKGIEQLYAVNYGEGFILVPTTKAFVPIAAICNGTYDNSTIIPQEQLLIEDMCERIAANREEERYDEYSDAWEEFERKSVLWYDSTETKGLTPAEAYEEMEDEWEGLDVYYIGDSPSYVPPGIYQSFNATVQQDYQNNACVYPEYAVITKESSPDVVQYGPYTKTSWNQTYPYNSSVPGGLVLGCLTVAVGQLMRSYGMPAGIAWGAMPDATSNTTLSNFLATLRSDLSIDNNGNGYLVDAKDYLNSRPYNCYSSSHSKSTVKTSIQNKRPLIMFGYREEADSLYGHFWVCDGYRQVSPKTIYRLYVLIQNGNEIEYYNRRTEEITSPCMDYFRMNWGWGGSHNGYYYEDTVQPTPTSNYCLNRKDLFVTNRQALYY